MQISDLVKQYHQAISSGAETLTGTKGVENLVASLRSLTKGNIFEGTVTSVKNGRVTLSLSGGQQVMARLDGKISLMEGGVDAEGFAHGPPQLLLGDDVHIQRPTPGQPFRLP